jgi:hypothetical protein
MITHLSYGTYIFFGVITYLGAAFVWFYVPETKRITLEEMDVIFGSEGTSQADFERMEEINKEIGLDRILRQGSSLSQGSGDEGGKGVIEDEEKRESAPVHTEGEVAHEKSA